MPPPWSTGEKLEAGPSLLTDTRVIFSPSSIQRKLNPRNRFLVQSRTEQPKPQLQNPAFNLRRFRTRFLIPKQPADNVPPSSVHKNRENENMLQKLFTFFQNKPTGKGNILDNLLFNLQSIYLFNFFLMKFCNVY